MTDKGLTVYYKFVAYIPTSDLDGVKQALFDAGAGQFGCYTQCSWQVLGVGQFFPQAGANPSIGAVGTLTSVDEWRVEMIVPKDNIQAVVQAYKLAHPYEVPAYDVYEMVFVEAF